jgi:HAMP domain-containing protein
MIRALAASAAALALVAAAAPVAAQDWRAIAAQDLAAARDELKANHPAAVVPGPGDTFGAWVDAGYDQISGELGRVRGARDYYYVLQGYAGGFRDNNIRLSPSYEPLPAWFAAGTPNFATAWRDGGYVVSWVKPGVRGLPPLGARVVSCDDTPIEEFARARLDRWEGNLQLEAERVRTAPYLLWDRDNAFAPGLPRQCRFQDGRRQRNFVLTAALTTEEDRRAAWAASVYAAPTPLAVEMVDGRGWIHAHTLGPDADWRAFYAAIEAQRAALQGPAGLVIDLRGASDADPEAARRGYGLVNRLWTVEFTAPRQPEAGAIVYRATQGNRDWYAQTLARMEADPLFVSESMPVIEQTRAIVAAFDAAIAAGQPSFTLPGRPAFEDTGAPNPVQGKVVVLVDSGCAGGCLDLVDLLLNLPNVTLAGAVTNADSIFIEATDRRLPSNYGDLSYGHKAWTTRERGHNVPHTPQAIYPGNPTDEAAVRAWVNGLFAG